MHLLTLSLTVATYLCYVELHELKTRNSYIPLGATNPRTCEVYICAHCTSEPTVRSSLALCSPLYRILTCTINLPDYTFLE